MKFLFRFLFLFSFLFSLSHLDAQVDFSFSSDSPIFSKEINTDKKRSATQPPSLRNYFKIELLRNDRHHKQAFQSSPTIYNYHHLPIFCKLEADMEKNNGLPIKMRLGTVQHVDYLEGKLEDWKLGNLD